MWAFSIHKEIIIDQHIHEVWDKLKLFETQRLCSPWLSAEDTAHVELSGPDATVWTIESWSGDIIGAWEREITHIVDGELIDYELRFTKPFKSTSRTYLSLQKCGKDCTRVVWGMEGTMPWFMKFSMKKMISQIEADYERGLDMMKYHVETGLRPTKLSSGEIKNVAESWSIGIERQSSLVDMPKQIQEDFATLWKFVTQYRTWSHGARSYYMKVDMKRDIYYYRSSILLNEDEIHELDDALLENTEIKKYYYPAMKQYCIRMEWSYRFMGNAWNAVFMHMRAKKMSYTPKFPSFEDYINDPSQVPEHKYITDICAPIK